MKKIRRSSATVKASIKPINETPTDLSHFISMDQIVALSVFNKEFSDLKDDLKKQKEFSWQIVVGVAVVFVIAILSAVWEVIIFHTGNKKDVFDVQKESFFEINALKNEYDQKFTIVQQQIDNLKSSVK